MEIFGVIIFILLLVSGIVYSYKLNGKKKFFEKNFDTAAIRFLILILSILISAEIYSCREEVKKEEKLEELKIEERNRSEKLLSNLIKELEYVQSSTSRIKINNKYKFYQLNPILLEEMIKREFDLIEDFELLNNLKFIVGEIDKVNNQVEFMNFMLTSNSYDENTKKEEIEETNSKIEEVLKMINLLCKATSEIADKKLKEIKKEGEK